jgi:alginate O-acetyltransferase complex protein AlgI
MWYLNIKVLAALFLLVCSLGIISKINKTFYKQIRPYCLLVFSILLLFFLGKKLLIFYAGYVVCMFIFYKLLLILTGKMRKVIFAFSIIFSLIPFIGFKLIDANMLILPTTIIFVAVGFSYNILKVIDTFYMAYFADYKVNFITYANFILFFPTFTSGPILKLPDFSKELKEPANIDSNTVEISVKRIILGLFKKIVLVEILIIFYNYLIASNLTVIKSTLTLLIYYILLYFDFSGYSDIAIGFSRLLGIQVPENFKKPFTSPTLTQFWRNWHASLGDWFREHIFNFISNKNMTRIVAGIWSFIVMLIIGVWHGFQILFLLWGAYHGLLLFFENILNMTTVNKKKTNKIIFYTRCVLVNLIIAFGTIFFSKDAHTAVSILRGFITW